MSAKADAVIEELRSDFERYLTGFCPFGAALAVVNDANEPIGYETYVDAMRVVGATPLPDGDYGYVVVPNADAEQGEEVVSFFITDPSESVRRGAHRFPLLSPEGTFSGRWLLLVTELPPAQQKRLEAIL